MDAKALLTNKTSLYIVLGVSIASLFGYLVGRRTDAVLFFILAGYVTSHFTKNMTVIMLVPLLLTNFVFSFNRMREGLENKENANNSAPTAKELSEAEGNSGGSGGAAPAPVDIGAKMAGHEDDVSEDAGVAPKGKKAAKKGAKGGDDDDAEVVPHPEVDKKKTREMAYSYFDKVMDAGDIDKISESMTNMVERHDKLANLIEKMTPLIGKAENMLEKVGGTDMGNIENMMKKMGGLRKQLPWIYGFMMAGTLGLIGLPILTNGGFSKELIITQAHLEGQAGYIGGWFVFAVAVIV